MTKTPTKQAGWASKGVLTVGRARRKAPPARAVCCIYWAVVILALVVASLLVTYAPGLQQCECPPELIQMHPDYCAANKSQQPQQQSAKYNVSSKSQTRTFDASFTWTWASIVGNAEHAASQASVLVVASFFICILSTVSAAHVVTFKPDMVPTDFEEKATLSNVCQNIATPHGRMFAVMLFTACLLSSVSAYTYHIHVNWYDWARADTWFFNTLQGRREKFLRIIWATVPHVSLMYTSLLPSLSKRPGTVFALTMVHNVTALLGLSVAVVGESVQLITGENAFSYFFCDAAATYFGPLLLQQRVRAVFLCYAWIAIAVFLSIQAYLGLGSVLGMRITVSYNLAMVSFYSEVSALVLVFALPAIKGGAIMIEHQTGHDIGLVLEEIMTRWLPLDGIDGVAPLM